MQEAVLVPAATVGATLVDVAQASREQVRAARVGEAFITLDTVLVRLTVIGQVFVNYTARDTSAVKRHGDDLRTGN